MKQTCFRISLAVTLVALTGLVAARPHAAQGTLLWQQNVNGTANGVDQALSVASEGWREGADALWPVMAAGVRAVVGRGGRMIAASPETLSGRYSATGAMKR